MLIVIPRAARPDAAYWPGRRALASVDAVIWPLVWIATVTSAQVDTGIVGRAVVAFALLFAVRRVHRAVWRNERYRFTTWRWGGPIVVLSFMAAAMKAFT
jgi:hypothetical protein